MEQKIKLLTAAARRLELPVDVVGGVPRMELIGQDLFSLEPHGGLLAYSDSQIVIRSAMGPVELLGKDLTVKLMNGQRIVITGRLGAVRLPGGCFE